eukprot:jgi/Ulvmu1/1976/UM012_0138.1
MQQRLYDQVCSSLRTHITRRWWDCLTGYLLDTTLISVVSMLHPARLTNMHFSLLTASQWCEGHRSRLPKTHMTHAGNEHSEARSYIACWSGVMAETWAFAAARASVSAHCYTQRTYSGAQAEIEAAVDALTHSYDACTNYKRTEGHSDATSDGDADTHIIDATH